MNQACVRSIGDRSDFEKRKTKCCTRIKGGPRSKGRQSAAISPLFSCPGLGFSCFIVLIHSVAKQRMYVLVPKTYEDSLSEDTYHSLCVDRDFGSRRYQVDH